MNFSRIVHKEICARKDFQITAQSSDQNQEKDEKGKWREQGTKFWWGVAASREQIKKNRKNSPLSLSLSLSLFFSLFLSKRITKPPKKISSSKHSFI